jgi:hypothetical protein
LRTLKYMHMTCIDGFVNTFMAMARAENKYNDCKIHPAIKKQKTLDEKTILIFFVAAKFRSDGAE